MLLSALIAETAARRTSGGLYLQPQEIELCGIRATRRYAAYGYIIGLPLDNYNTLDRPQEITLSLELTTSEWGVIGPLFELYLEFESALRIEATRGLGMELTGRSSSEVQGDINAFELELPRLAFHEPAYTVGAAAVLDMIGGP